MVAAKFNTATLVLNAGLLKITLTDEAGTPLDVKPSWSILGPANAEGKQARIAYSYDKVPTFVLPAGPCTIRVKYDKTSASAEAEVSAGRLTEFTLKAQKP